MVAHQQGVELHRYVVEFSYSIYIECVHICIHLCHTHKYTHLISDIYIYIYTYYIGISIYDNVFVHFLQSCFRWNGFYPSSFLLNTFPWTSGLSCWVCAAWALPSFHRQVGHRCQRHASWAEEIGRKMILSFKMLLPTGNPIPSPIPYPGTFESSR